MKILINGGCGFLGSNLAYRALSEKHELHIIDNLSRLGSEKNYEWLLTCGSFKFTKEDIRNKDVIEKVIKSFKPDVIFHLAGQVAMTSSIENPRNDFEINVLGTLNVLESVRLYSPETMIFYSSTNKVYGDLEWVNYIEESTRYLSPDYHNGFNEKTPLDFRSPYGCSKGAADQYILDYSRVYDLKTVVFRHSSMFGGRQFSTCDQGWIGWFCLKAIEISKNKNDGKFTISGNGKQVRDVLFADDMVNLYFQSVKKIEVIKGNAFNIGGGMENSLSLLELFSFLESKLSISMDYEELPWRKSDQKVFVADLTKINSMVGWQPKINKEKGICKMIEWVNTNA
ncbi:MAG: NAD-dependent epimerase/dehydratase family protein [bacterium]|nr:NAD-dependent epimerase/dehydratase family protein [bacterium]